jgi:outer membrane protein OmpA-like peptidoglycan-associated protein
LEGESLRGQDNSKTPTEFKSDLLIVGGGLTAGYSFNDRFFPYVFAGVSNIWFSPKDKDGKRLDNNRLGLYERSSISYDAEIGSRFVLNGVLSAFVGFGFHFPQTDYLDDVSKGSFDDFYYSGRIGISLSLFGKKDFDGDGILDYDDTCPSNSEDFDGFQDDDGCPDFDNDKDGIVDERDKCPNDPEDKDGFQDTDGCPDLDNDNDGIPDREDKCPNEPENINGFEDKDGCPDILDSSQRLLDNDKDGIVNNLDKCPDQAETINGFEDEDGCPDSIVVSDTISVKEMILEGSLLFDWRGTNIKPTAYEELDKTAAILVNDPFIKWAVNSYTDNNGNSDSLKSLSLERAKSVVRYLINTGLPSFMFRVYGKGGESPIGDNNTLEGRMKNNRIVIKRLD